MLNQAKLEGWECIWLLSLIRKGENLKLKKNIKKDFPQKTG